MQTAAKKSFSLTEFFSFKGLAVSPASKYAALYQQIISGLSGRVASKQTVYTFAQHIAELAHQAYNVRQLGTVELASQILISLPEPWKHIGSYYQAKCLRHQGNIAEANAILEQVAEKAPFRYRARAVQFMGAIYHTTGHFQEALPFYVEACKMAKYNWCDPHTIVTASQNIAILKSIDGDHKGALGGLQELFPLVQSLGKIEPYKYHHYLNSFSVELIEVGRVEEAANISRIVLASPFAFAYPEWRETWQEVALRGYKSRSAISVLKPALDKDNVVPMPVVERSSDPPQQGSAKLFDLKKWAKKMGKKPNGDEKKEDLENMDEKDLMVKLMYLATDERLTENKLRKLIEYALQVLSEPED